MPLLSPNLFPKLAAIRSRTGISRTGDFSFGTAVNIKARIENREEIVRSFAGEMVKSSHILYTTTPVARHDIVFLDRADVLNLSKGLEPISLWQTHALDGGEVLYKVWLSFF